MTTFRSFWRDLPTVATGVPTCTCGHAQQIHGADHPGGYLSPGGRRGSGACSASRCWCPNYLDTSDA